MSDLERRIIVLERLVAELRRQLAETEARARATAQDLGRVRQPGS